MTIAGKTIWDAPDQEPNISEGRDGRSEYDLDRWRILVQQVADAANRNNWSKTDCAKRMQVPSGTFSQWYSGKYAGRLDETNKRVALWIESLEVSGGFAARLVKAPPFIKTRTAIEIGNTLDVAHQFGSLVIVTTEAGMGKTQAFKNHTKTRPHAYMATMRPHTKTVHGMLVELAASLGLTQHNPAQLDRTIGTYLSRAQAPTILIVDEAQNLIDQAIDQLRYFSDEHGIGVVLGGNTEIYGRFTKRADGPSYAQIKRRVAKRYQRLRPYREDMEMLIDAWGITEPEMVTYLVGLGTKPGALGNIDQTLKQAHLIAMGSNMELTIKLLKAAWKEREMEDVNAIA